MLEVDIILFWQQFSLHVKEESAIYFKIFEITLKISCLAGYILPVTQARDKPSQKQFKTWSVHLQCIWFLNLKLCLKWKIIFLDHYDVILEEPVIHKISSFE